MKKYKIVATFEIEDKNISKTYLQRSLNALKRYIKFSIEDSNFPLNSNAECINTYPKKVNINFIGD